tara:strand:+ start:3028 stop:3702 length:675 start_codon:yes stop_codon:yes gene_type:complete
MGHGELTIAIGAMGRIPTAIKLERLMTPTDTGFPTERTPNDTEEMLMISVQMWELQYLSSSEKSLSKRTALKKRAITHKATTHVITVALLSSGLGMTSLSLGFLDAATLFFALVNIQLFITDAPWNSGWSGFGVTGRRVYTGNGAHPASIQLGPEARGWMASRLVPEFARRDLGTAKHAVAPRGDCPAGFEMRSDDPLGVCRTGSEWRGYVCSRKGEVLLGCFE